MHRISVLKDEKYMICSPFEKNNHDQRFESRVGTHASEHGRSATCVCVCTKCANDRQHEHMNGQRLRLVQRIMEKIVKAIQIEIAVMQIFDGEKLSC